MRATRFTGDSAPAGATVAVGVAPKGDPRSALDHPYGAYGFQYRGMGGAVTNVWDLWRWDRALRGDRVLGEATKTDLFKPGLNDYALGWFVRKDARGRLVHSHGGSVRGFICEVRRYPEEDGALFVLSNRNDAPLWQVVQGVETILFGEALPVHPPRALDAAVARAVAGTYRDIKSGSVLGVETIGGVTRTRLHWHPPEGPVIEGCLGQDDDGRVVLFDWKSSTPVKLTRAGTKPPTAVTIDGIVYDRGDAR
jgi:hypothetical protein